MAVNGLNNDITLQIARIQEQLASGNLPEGVTKKELQVNLQHLQNLQNQLSNMRQNSNSVPSGKGERLLNEAQTTAASVIPRSSKKGDILMPANEVAKKMNTSGSLSNAASQAIEARDALEAEHKSPMPATELLNRISAAMNLTKESASAWNTSEELDRKQKDNPSLPAKG